MPLSDWFKQKREKQVQQLSAQLGSEHLSEQDIEKMWTQCYDCNVQLPTEDFENNLWVCPKCDYHFRLSVEDRIKQLCDEFTPLFEGLTPGDPLQFTDLEPYLKRQASAAKKTKKEDAVITGKALIKDQPCAMGIMDFSYMGGSMGSVVGEKLTRLIEFALAETLPLIIITASGGARMQEGIFSLMQMAKTSAALAKLHEAGLLYITLCSEPTFGGVTASYGMLGDIILAEDGARIGFAGRRVIEQTIRQKLPPEFQTADYLKTYGQVDNVVHRKALKAQVYDLLRLHQKSLAISGSYNQRRLG